MAHDDELMNMGQYGGRHMNDDDEEDDYHQLARGQYQMTNEEHEEDLAWRAIRATQGQGDMTYGMGTGNGSPGTFSSDGDGDESWDGLRQYK